MVEVANELRVDGAAELGQFPVCRSDEDTLHLLHQHIVEQSVLCPRRQPGQHRTKRDWNGTEWNGMAWNRIEENGVEYNLNSVIWNRIGWTERIGPQQRGDLWHYYNGEG